jgi:hypothetical protein
VSPARPPVKPPAANPWHAVAVIASRTPCQAATQLAGRRFLSADAPRLPLPQCTWPMRCGCTYRHYEDRRVNLRRGADRGMYGRTVPVERRKGGERRRIDD